MLATVQTQTLSPATLPRNVMNRLTWLGVGIGWLLVACSLAFPAFLVEWPKGTTAEYPSVGIFLFGWLGVLSILDGQFDMIGWLANPLFFLTSFLLIARQYRGAAITGAFSIAFALASFLLKSATMNEAGHVAPVIAFNAGFHLWLTAICWQACLAWGWCFFHSDKRAVEA